MDSMRCATLLYLYEGRIAVELVPPATWNLTMGHSWMAVIQRRVHYIHDQAIEGPTCGWVGGGSLAHNSILGDALIRILKIVQSKALHRNLRLCMPHELHWLGKCEHASHQDN